MNEPCSRRLPAGRLEAVSGQCASVRRHHRHRSPDTETVLAFTLGQDSQRIHKLMHVAVTSPVVPIYSGDKQRANHRSELAIPAARSTGGLRCRWSITATS
jgi:hypothetical protein